MPSSVSNISTNPRRLIITTGVATGLLLLPSLLVWAIGWKWAPGGDAWIKGALLLTDTAGFPYAIVTALVFAGIFAWMLRAPLRTTIGMVLLCAAALLCSQGIKSALKGTFQKSRPYTDWVAGNHDMPAGDFYALSRGDRAAWLHDNLSSDAKVNSALLEHWTRETGYSLPSGHTMFVAIWALLGVAILWPRGERTTKGGRIICVLLIIWAVAVETTRMVLGMHWPGDLALAVLISWLIVVSLVPLWLKCCPVVLVDKR